jgi:hypothetical protein
MICLILLIGLLAKDLVQNAGSIWQQILRRTRKILCKFLPWVAFWLRYKTLAYLGLQRIEGSMEQWQPQERCHEQLETQRATARIGKTLLPNVLLWVVSLGPSKK